MPSPSRSGIISQISNQLIVEAQSGRSVLPMPHGRHGKVSCADFQEYHLRKGLYNREFSSYEGGFNRPAMDSVEDIWGLLAPYGARQVDDLIQVTYIVQNWVSDSDYQILARSARQAFVIALDTFIAAGQNSRNITYNHLFDALCRSYSDHYRWTPAMEARDMAIDTAYSCRRDLLLHGVDVNKIWDLIGNDPSQGNSSWQNPLFAVQQQRISGPGELKSLDLKDPAILSRFHDLLNNDSRYHRSGVSGLEALLVDTGMKRSVDPGDDDDYEVCADVPYNKIILGEHSKRLLRLQSEARLLLDVSAFNDDYTDAEKLASELAEQLEHHGVNPLLPSAKRQTSDGKEIWSRREEELYYVAIARGLHQLPFDKGIATQVEEVLETGPDRKRYERHLKRYTERYAGRPSNHGVPGDGFPDTDSLSELVESALGMRQWRREMVKLLSDYDRVRRHVNTYALVRQQVKDLTGYQSISSDFYRTINRRYQPKHFCPTYVTSKNSALLVDEEEQHQNYRSRWFKTQDSETGGIRELVGVDISSSQTQIIAALMGIHRLEAVSMGEAEKPFKEFLAELAWGKHQDPKDEFSLKPEGRVTGYSGSHDDRLEELVKSLWLRNVYGSTPYVVVEDQGNDLETYGPGWTTTNANSFLEKDLYEDRFPEVKQFLEMCRRLAEVASQQDRCAGVTFTDPFDSVEVRWNPVLRNDDYISNDGHKLALSLPGTKRKEGPKKGRLEICEPDFNGEFSVDQHKLTHMIAPCMVHMLDAYYSSLVMQGIHDRGITDFVGIHDCWLVPEKVSVGGLERKGIDILREAIEKADHEWYMGLEPVYKDLLRYLGDDPRFSGSIQSAYTKWKHRVKNGDHPRFKYTLE